MSHVRRFDHVGLTVADLDVVTAFFVALGLEVDERQAGGHGGPLKAGRRPALHRLIPGAS